MIYFILLIAGNILVVTSGFNLSCTNDLDKLISCYIVKDDCAGLLLKMDRLNNDGSTSMKGTCKFDRRCCCITKWDWDRLSHWDDFSATIYKDEQLVHYQEISISDTYKPPAPNISVEKINGKPQIQWCLSASDFIHKAIVTYQEKGSNNKTSVHKNVTKKTETKNCYEIDDLRLESDKTYVVSVQIYTTYGVTSDSSNEVNFPSASEQQWLITIIVCLCVIIVIAGVIVVFLRLKGKLWDEPAKEERPKLWDIQPKKKMIMIPEPLSVYSLSVEPLVPKNSLTMSKESLSDISSGQTSGISTATSSSNDLRDGPTLQDFITPPHVSNAMETDMSYQPSPLSGEASRGSQSLPVISDCQDLEKSVEQSNNSSTEETEECLSLIQGVSDHVPSVSHEMIVDLGYHCVSEILWSVMDSGK